MTSSQESIPFFVQLATAFRLVLATMFVCCVLYTLVIYGLGQAVVPFTANGSLVYNDKGQVVGSKALAQAFTRPEYFWPRPSAVDYNAAATGGSNLSPTSDVLRERAAASVRLYGATPEARLPADLATTSGAGLDPHITLRAARYQAARVAGARGIREAAIIGLIDRLAFHPGGPLTPESLVNVLELNRALDALKS